MCVHARERGANIALFLQSHRPDDHPMVSSARPGWGWKLIGWDLSGLDWVLLHGSQEARSRDLLMEWDV